MTEEKHGRHCRGSATMGRAANETAELFAEVEGEILAADVEMKRRRLITVGEDRMLEEGEMTTADGTIVGRARVEQSIEC